MNKIVGIILITTSLFGTSFSESKKILLKKIYYDHKETFYCKNPYEIKRIKGKEKTVIIQNEQYYSPRNKFTRKGKINVRALRVEWEHIVPAYNFGRQLPCWKKGGRKSCKKDKKFRIMSADMMNLVPSIGEINGDRSNYRYGFKEPSKGMYGNCNFEVDFKAHKAFIDSRLRGFVARTYLYMNSKYGINLSKRDFKQFKIWDKKFPADKWEIERKRRIQKELR